MTKDGAHDYHPALPGYRDSQLFVDGCHECERRIQRGPMFALTTQDPMRIRLAWNRALRYAAGEQSDASQLERLLFVELERVAMILDRVGVLPYGELLGPRLRGTP